MAIPIPVDLVRCTPPVAGGFLQEACPLPQDWERGISFQDTACLTPTVMGECPTCPDLKPTQTAETATFRPVSLISAFRCSVMGGVDVQVIASQSMTETADYALARELLTGEASRRDANPNAIDGAGGNPSLQGSAVNLGDAFVDPVAAVGCLEQMLADTTGGRRGYLLVGPEIALQMAAFDVLVETAGRLSTPTGTRVIVDGGFDGRAPIESPGDESPGCELWNTTGSPVMGDQLYMYAVSGLWAGVGAASMISDVNRRNNTAEARSEQIGLPVFAPCAVFAAGSSVEKAC